MTGWWKPCAAAAIDFPSSNRISMPRALPRIALSYNTRKHRIFILALVAE